MHAIASENYKHYLQKLNETEIEQTSDKNYGTAEVQCSNKQM